MITFDFKITNPWDKKYSDDTQYDTRYDTQYYTKHIETKLFEYLFNIDRTDILLGFTFALTIFDIFDVYDDHDLSVGLQLALFGYTITLQLYKFKSIGKTNA